MSREVEVTINPDGTVSLDAKGFAGKGCTEILNALARGFRKTEERKKKEYHVVATGKVTR